MALTLYRKLEGNSLREFTNTATNTHWVNDTLVLQPKFGTLTLDLKGLGVISCVMRFKRISGNGLIMISTNGMTRDYQINSKSAQSVSVNIGSEEKIVLHRTNRSRGDLAILDISLFVDVNTKSDWNSILSKCDGHACLRLVGDNLHASEGAWVTGQNIRIQTEPPGMFVANGNTIKFLGSCRIVELSSDGSVQIKEPPIKSINLPIKKEESVPITRESESVLTVVAQGSEEQVQIRETLPTITTNQTQPSSSIVYDSQVTGFSQNYCNKFANASSSGIVIDHRGGYSIPLRDLIPNKKYLIKVNVTRINGNGKFMFGVLPDNGMSATKIAIGGNQEFSIEIRPIIGGGSYSLSVWRHPSAKGEIKLTRLLVISEADAAPLETREISHIDLQYPITLVKSVVSNQQIPEFSSNRDADPLWLGNGITDPITRQAVQFSRAVAQSYEPSSKLDIKSTIKTNTVLGMRWLGTVKPFLPNVEFSDQPHASISHINDLIPAKKMYIEEFSEAIPDEAVDTIKSAELIFVASNLNAEAIRQKTGINNIRIIPRRLPYITPKPLNFIGKDYVLLNNEDPLVTEYVLKALEPLNTKIVLLGARGRVPQNVFGINEYLPYDQLLSVFENARVFIDLPIVEDQTSSYIDLALVNGLQVVSSSWAYMELPQVLFITGTKLVGTRLVPEEEDLREAVRDSRKSNTGNFEDLSKNFEEFSRTLLG